MGQAIVVKEILLQHLILKTYSYRHKRLLGIGANQITLIRTMLGGMRPIIWVFILRKTTVKEIRFSNYPFLEWSCTQFQLHQIKMVLTLCNLSSSQR